MTEEEFSRRINELKSSRKAQLQKMNNNVKGRIDALSIQGEVKNIIQLELRAKAVEFRDKEEKNLKEIVDIYKSIIKRINEDVEISDEERQIQINDAQEYFLEAYENNQNGMINLREEYINFNLVTRESFYSHQEDNSSSAAVSYACAEKEESSFLGANNKFFDPSGEGGSQI